MAAVCQASLRVRSPIPGWSKTLDFVEICATAWNVPVVWVEYDRDAPHRTRLVVDRRARALCRADRAQGFRAEPEHQAVFRRSRAQPHQGPCRARFCPAAGDVVCAHSTGHCGEQCRCAGSGCMPLLSTASRASVQRSSARTADRKKALMGATSNTGGRSKALRTDAQPTCINRWRFPGPASVAS